jgi:hypothetical protein
MPISRDWYDTLVDDDGSGTTGSIIDKADFDAILDAIDAMPAPLTPLYALAFHSTTQSLSNATLTAITFNSEDYDVTALHSTATNPSRMTVPTGAGGLYQIDGKIFYDANATGIRVARIQKNGALISTQVTHPGTAAGQQCVAVSIRLVLVAGDYVELVGFQDSGGPLNTGDATTRVRNNELSIVRLA